MKSINWKLLFLINFLKNPLRNASIIPSSAIANKKMIEWVDFSKINTIVELWPGDWCLTTELVKQCKSDCQIILIELEKSYIWILEEKFIKNKNVQIENESAHLLESILEKYWINKVDLIVSWLPYLPKNIKTPLLKTIKKQIELWAIFRMFTYTPAIMKIIYKPLKLNKLHFVLKNFPPLWVYWAN